VTFGVEVGGPTYGSLADLIGVHHDFGLLLWVGISGDSTGTSGAAGLGIRYWHGWTLTEGM
jgi:hypothetical protein